MALLCDIGAGWSQSFQSVAEADVIIQGIFPTADYNLWHAQTTAEKEFDLEQAALFMGLGWCKLRGYKAYRGQKLVFPRIGQEVFGYSLTEIPLEAKKAHAYIAVAIIYRNKIRRKSVTKGTGNTKVNSFSIAGVSIALGEGVAGAGTLEEYIKDQHLTLLLLLQGFIVGVRAAAIKERRYLAPVTSTSSTTTTSTTSISTTTVTTTVTATTA